MKRLIVLLLIAGALKLDAQVMITPQPVTITERKGTTTLPEKPVIYTDKANEGNAAYLNDYLKEHYGISATVKKGADKKTTETGIHLVKAAGKGKAGSYELATGDGLVNISGNTEEGVFYGIQSLLQLLPADQHLQGGKKLVLPLLTINDYPRFAYRGMHLDVSRHFFPVSYIRRYIDYLAFHKFNTFHWHLTDDQGWRIEIKQYPSLTETGAWRNGSIIGKYPGTGNDGIRYGGYYTQEQIREIVRYAAERHITVIPEIEMPGHSLAALAAYPFLGCTKGPYKVLETWGGTDDVLCAGNDSTFVFYQHVLDEVIALFPSKYIHIGGDECLKKRWKTCPVCQARIRKEGLKNEKELQSYFVQRMEKYINGKGRKIIGWDEILEGGLAPNATVMSWTGEQGGIAAANQRHTVIMTPGAYCYFDHSQVKNDDSLTIGGFLPLEKVYNYEPVPKGIQAANTHYVLGAQANLWTEYIGNTAKLEYMIFPRMSALAEVLWTPAGGRSYQRFKKKLPVLYDWYGFLGANYSKAN